MTNEFDHHDLALFPGQGAIAAGAGAPWVDSPAWSIVSDISDVTGVDVAALLLRSPDDELVRTDRAQLATFSLSLVGWQEYLSVHGAPHYIAGHSLGEFSALVAAGILNLADGARLVAVRGRAMRDASSSHPGGMVALMGGDEVAGQRLATLDDLWVANVNGPGQIVVSGTTASVAYLLEHARELGWRRASALSVGGAFHSPLMSDASPALHEALDDVTFQDSEHEVAANVDGVWRHGGDQWRSLIQAQLVSPVQFSTMIANAPSDVVRCVEMPPAGVLAGLVKRIRDFDDITPLTAPFAKES